MQLKPKKCNNVDRYCFCCIVDVQKWSFGRKTHQNSKLFSKIYYQKNKEKIVKLLNENIDLQYKLNLKNYHRFSEEVKNIGSKKEPKEVKIKIGHWYEWVKCEDKPNEKGIKIERCRIIKIDGQKSDHWNKIKYFSADDI